MNNINIAVISSHRDFYKPFFPIIEILHEGNYRFHFINHSGMDLDENIEIPGEYIQINNEKSLVQYLIDNKIDIVHSDVSKEIGYLAHLANVKRVIQHPFEEFTSQDVALSPIDCICCYDQKIHDTFKKQYPNKYVTSIHDSINTVTYSPARRNDLLRNQYGFNQDDIVIGFIGKIIRPKYFGKIIDIFSKLKKSNKNLKLLIDGNDYNKPFEEILKKISTDNNLNENILFINDRNDLLKLISNIDIAIIKPETYFNVYGDIITKNEKEYNYTLMETMAFGIPFITVRKNIEKNQHSFIRNNENCFTVELDNMDAYYSTLEELIKNEDIRRRFGENSRKIIKNNFDSTTIKKDYEQHYKYLLSDQFNKDYPLTRKDIKNHFLGNMIDLKELDLDRKNILIVRSGSEKKTSSLISDLVDKFPEANLSALCHKRNYREIKENEKIHKIFTYNKSDVFESRKMKSIIKKINRKNYDYIFFVLNNPFAQETYKNIEGIINLVKTKENIMISNGDFSFIYPVRDKQDNKITASGLKCSKILDTQKDYVLTTHWESNINKLPECDRFKLDKHQEIFSTCNKILYCGDKTRDIVQLFSDELKDKELISMDIIEKHHVDIVGDICDLHMFEDNSIDGIICYAILEHVYNPFQAVEELYRVLKPGGKIMLLLPWLWEYHGYKDEMLDYYRFSKDGIRYLFKDFSHLELSSIRGKIEGIFVCVLKFIKMRTKIHELFARIIRKFDNCTDNDPSAFNVFAIK